MIRLKCFWCKGKSKLGAHAKCWKVFSGWMLSSRDVADNVLIDDEKANDYLPNGQTYKDDTGHNVIEGKVMPSLTND